MKRALGVVAAAVLLAGCTGVPASSGPQTIEPAETDGASAAAKAPCLDCPPRDIVTNFLDQNAGSHPVARQYLTPPTSNRWSDDTATIIGNDDTVGTYDRGKHTVVVSGRVLGTLDGNGIYTPSLLGGSGPSQPFVFHLVHRSDGWRIDKLRPGLLLTDSQFRDTYRQQKLYFYNLAEDSLVPDLRWSPLDDKKLLAEWLLRQIVSGPRPELSNAVSADTMPAHIDPSQIEVTLGTPSLIKIPGSSQLGAGVRYRLAAQLSQTLIDALAGREMTITDGGEPVGIPSVGGYTFSAADFPTATGPATPPPEVYYLRGGRIRDDSGNVLTGGIADDGSLSTFAIGQSEPGAPVFVAGVTGSGSGARLEVGTRSAGLRPTKVRGTLSRPSFVPGRNEVWIGVGSQVYRVVLGDGRPHVEQVPIPAVSGGGRVVALRLSPEGSRVAIVVAGADGSRQLYIGSIVRGSGQVRVDSLDPISPKGAVIDDVAWLDPFKLFAIGTTAGIARTFEAGVDGTDWTSAATGLPDPPDSVTAATSSSVWVSASGFVWKQSGNTWESPGPAGQTPGRAPVYLE